MTAIYWPDFLTLIYPLPSDAINEGVPRVIGYVFGMGKVEWLGYSPVKVA